MSTDNYKEDSSLTSQDAKNVNLSRQNKFIKGEYLEYQEEYYQNIKINNKNIICRLWETEAEAN